MMRFTPMFVLLSLGAAACAGGAADEAIDGGAESGEACPRLRVVFSQDLTGSRSRKRTPRLTAEALAPVIEYIGRCGGEVAVGTIAAESDLPLVRLAMPRPPVPPTPPVLRGTPFQQSRQRQEYAQALAKYDSASAVTEQARVAAESVFVGRVTALLNEHVARRTDVYGAIERAALFLGEPVGRDSTRLAAVLITDGEDNVGARRVELPAGSLLYVVNGDPVPGVLGQHVLRFEGIEAVVAHLLSQGAQ